MKLSRRGLLRALLLAMPLLLLAPLAPLALQAQAGTGAHVRTASQAGVEAEVERLSRALQRAQRDHLWRVGGWGALNLVAGTALAASADQDSAWRGFGVQSAGWGAVNLGIAALGLLAGPGEATDDWREALDREDGYTHLLLVNLGLNVAYSAVGTTLVVVSGRGLDEGDSVRGHGAALIVQGMGLLALDLAAWLGSRRRGQALKAEVPLTVAPGPDPGSASLTLLSVPLGP